MKSVIIALVIAVLGLGGWVIYDNVGDSSGSGNDSSQEPSSGVQSTSGKTLDLSNRGLTEISADIYNRTDVTELILSNNNLKSLKSEMGKMTNLEVLRLDHNSLEGSLIGEIRKMPLRTLDVSYNRMTGMPAEIGQLNKLEALDYSYNNITGLPNELSNLKNTLKEFNLTGNPLSQETLNRLKSMLPNTTIIF